MSKDLLFEIGLEELPSGEVLSLGKALQNNFIDVLTKQNIAYEKIEFYATPRRIAVIIFNLNESKPGSVIERRGPKLDGNDKNSPAVIGFAKSLNIDVDALTTVSNEKGSWWSFSQTLAEVKVLDLLENIITEVVLKLPVKKPMRWGDGNDEFVRPVHWGVLLFGEQVININILGITTSNVTYGHRFLHNHPVIINSPNEYEECLNKAYVIANFYKRENFIRENVQHLAAEKNLEPVMPDDLVCEVCSIVEWPVPILASFDERFLKVPPLALSAAITGHQKCFPVMSNNKMQPYFIAVANIKTNDNDFIVKGNENVMRARLSDAEFFYNNDKKIPLSDYIQYLPKVIFQIKLGTLNDKVERLKLLIQHLLVPLNLDNNLALRAVALSKCDLMTGMVGEFPELQGYMGQVYARYHHEDEKVATALYEQYLPRFAEDELPKSSLGIALSLIDRIDTLVGIFAIGQRPTGMKDPFKLRRHALAVVKLLINIDVKLDLSQLIARAIEGYVNLPKKDLDNTLQLQGFILDRLEAFYAPLNIKPDLILAVKEKQQDWLYDMHQRLIALKDFVQTLEAHSLAQASRRVNNILEKNENLDLSRDVNTALFDNEYEKSLYTKISELEVETLPLYSDNDYKSILSKLVTIKEATDAFFDNVMVLSDDALIRSNRLIMLKKLQTLLTGVADISKLQVDR